MSKKYSKEDVNKLAASLRNWGKWGEKDELGTLNYISRRAVTSAAKEIRTGDVYSLAIPLGQSGPQRGGFGRFNPVHLMTATGPDVTTGLQPRFLMNARKKDMGPGGGFADDIIIMPLQTATHWDALSHIFYDRKMWNGYDMNLIGSSGAPINDITRAKDRLVGRGVLLDMAGYKGVSSLSPGEAIYANDLEAAAKKENVTIEPGDFLLIRTGQLGYCLRKKDWGDYAGGPAPGLALDTAAWLSKKTVGGVASDTWGVEVIPNEVDEIFQPWHLVVIPNMGLMVGEMFYLEELASACARDNRYTFFFAGQPLPFEGAVGSPVNPLAIK